MATYQPKLIAEERRESSISLGSLEVLRQLGNPLSSGNAELANIDIGILTEFIWVHAAPLDEVMETVYNTPSQVKRKAASAIPQPDSTDSPNGHTPR